MWSSQTAGMGRSGCLVCGHKSWGGFEAHGGDGDELSLTRKLPGELESRRRGLSRLPNWLAPALAGIARWAPVIGEALKRPQTARQSLVGMHVFVASAGLFDVVALYLPTVRQGAAPLALSPEEGAEWQLWLTRATKYVISLLNGWTLVSSAQG
jgi:hypothetical protein